jgi:hypothetical protein
MNHPANLKITGVVVGGVITGLACLGFAILLLAEGIDRMNGGYALMLFAVFFAITGGVTTWLYAWRAAILKRILGGEGRLGRWTYPARQYEQEQEMIYRREKSEKSGLFTITTILLVAIGGCVFMPAYLNGDIRSPWVFLGYLGIILLIAFFAFGLPWLNYRSRRRRPMEAIIGREGLVLYGGFHPFKGALQSLVGVELKESEVVFSLRYLSRLSWFSYPVYTVSVPVPEGELETAQKIVTQFGKSQEKD